VDPAFVDRLAKDQAALAHRLLSIEEALARWHADTRGCSAGLAGTEAARGQHQPVDRSFGVASEATTVAFDDIGLHLTIGPYGRFLVMADDPIVGTLERGEFCDPYLRPIIERCGDQGRSAIDAGAGIGFHTVFMVRHFGRVHAFEQRTRCFRLLNANLVLNGCDQVLTYDVPLYVEEIAMEQTDGGPLLMAVSADGDAAESSDAGIDKAERFPVPGMRPATIDSLGLRDAAFIKLDARGYELRVLKGACGTIAASRPTIAIGFEEAFAGRRGDRLDDLRQFFAGCGYDLTEIALGGRKQWGYLATPK
jgi:FkbM family methyltransferase